MNTSDNKINTKIYDDVERLMMIRDELQKIKFINVDDITQLINKKIKENNPLR